MNRKQAWSRLNLPIVFLFVPGPHRTSTKTIATCAGAVISRLKQEMSSYGHRKMKKKKHDLRLEC